MFPLLLSLSFPSNLSLQASTLHHRVLLLTDSVTPFPVVILIDSSDATSLVDFHQHADMTLKVLARGFDSHHSIRPNNVIGLSTHPDHLNERSSRSRSDRLQRADGFRQYIRAWVENQSLACDG
jgi:hypothetical protein